MYCTLLNYLLYYWFISKIGENILNKMEWRVSRWERGLGFPDINTLEPLADTLGITLTELMRCSKEIEDTLDDGYCFVCFQEIN